MKQLMDLDQCIHKAIEYDENCAKGAFGTRSQTNESTQMVLSQVDEIIQGVTKRMQQMYGPPRVAKISVEQPYICGICGKNHPTSQPTQLPTRHLRRRRPHRLRPRRLRLLQTKSRLPQLPQRPTKSRTFTIPHHCYLHLHLQLRHLNKPGSNSGR